MSAAVKLHPRADDEWYVEPQWATELLLDHEDFAPVVWDPACGGGNVCRALVAYGYAALGTDIVRRAEGSDPWWRGERDFLTSPLLGGADIIVNPPFFRSVGTEAFIRHRAEDRSRQGRGLRRRKVPREPAPRQRPVCRTCADARLDPRQAPVLSARRASRGRERGQRRHRRLDVDGVGLRPEGWARDHE